MLTIRSSYSVSGTILIEDQASVFNPLEGMGSNLNYLENEMIILKSRSTADSTIRTLLKSEHKNSLHLFDTQKYNDPPLRNFFRNIFFLNSNETINDLPYDYNTIPDSLMNEFINKLRDNLTVKNERNSDILNVTYSSPSAYESSLIVNTLLEEYEEMDKNAASNEMKELREFLGKQLEDKEKEIREFDAKLKDFQEQQRIYGEKADKANLLLNQLSVVESDYYDSRSKKNVLINRKADFENQLTNDEKDFSRQIGNTLNAQLSKIRQELSAVEAEYILTKSREGNSHPAVISLKLQIDKLKKALNDETEKYINQESSVADPIEYRQSMIDSMIVLDARISGYDYKMRELDALISMYNDSLSSLPEKYLKYSQYQRDKVILDETYSLMKTKFAEAQINENSGRSKIREIDRASPFEYSSSPNKKIILLVCIILTFSIGAGGILLIEFLDSTVKSIDEIERRGLSILSIIPSIGQNSKGRKKEKRL